MAHVAPLEDQLVVLRGAESRLPSWGSGHIGPQTIRPLGRRPGSVRRGAWWAAGRRCDTADMGGHRPRACLLALAAALAAPTLYARWIRLWLLTWGANPEEITGANPGDDLVPDPDGGATMATTLPAPPERVWPWLVQMGGGRGGWYGWDWLDNDGQPSTDRIVGQWQRLEVGQHLYRAPKGPANWFTVVIVEPNRTLVLQSSYGSLTGQGFDPRSGPRPWAYVDGVWGFHLRPAAGGRTRLVARTCSHSRPRWLARPYGLLLGEPLHFLMQTRQFHNLHARVGAEA